MAGLVAALFFYIFPVTTVTGGIPLALIAYLLLGLLWLRHPIMVPMRALPVGIASTLICLALYAAFATLLLASNNFEFSKQIAKTSILYLGTGVIIGIICIGINPNKAFDIIITAFVICSLIQTFFISLSIASVAFRFVMNSVIDVTGNTNYLESFRVRGFSASGGSALSFIQAIGVLSSLYLLRTTRKSKYAYFALMIWIPILFVGRTGFYLSAIFIILHFANTQSMINFLRSVFLRPISLVVTAVVIASTPHVFQIMPDLFDSEAQDKVKFAVRWGFELFINAQDGEFSTATTDSLLDMLVIPTEPIYFTFGLGVFDSGAFGYERTDSGYLKTMYSSGIIGVLILYGTLYFAFFRVAMDCQSTRLKYYLLTILAAAIILEIKEPYLYQNYFGRYFLLLIGGGSVILWKKRRLRKAGRHEPVMAGRPAFYRQRRIGTA